MKYLSKHRKLFDKPNQSGLVQLMLMVLLLAGIGLGVYLVQTKTNLFPWAASNPISGPIFSPSPGAQKFVKVIYPNGGESFESGTTVKVTWEASGTTGYTLYMLDIDDPNYPTYLTAINDPNQKSYNWNVRKYNPNTPGRYKFRITSQYGDPNPVQDESDYYFTTYLYGSSPAPIPSPITDPSLYGYWKMDQSSVYADCTSYSIIDSSGNNRHAKGCPTLQSPTIASGKFNNGVYFDNYDYAQVKDSEGFNSANVTVAAWIKPNSYSGKYPRIISKNGSFDLHMYTWAGGEGRLEWDIRIPGETDTKTASHRLELNRWYHVGATYNGSVSRIYINGFKVAERTGLSGNIASTNNPILFAAVTPGDILRNLNATLDEVRVYTRALTDTEISALASQSN